MVILGGLEVVAAGYLFHKHNKNKRERQRIEEEAAALEEQQYHILPPGPRPSSSHHGRRHSHSHDRKHSYDRKHSHDRRHSHDRKHSRHRKDSRPPQYVPPPYASQPNLAVPRPQYQAPPPQPYPQPQPQPQPQAQAQQGYYPPTGIPAHWENAKAGPQQQQGQPMKYGFYDGQEHASSQDLSRGRTAARGSSPYGYGNERSRESRVRFAEEDEMLGSEDRRSPPPQYRV